MLIRKHKGRYLDLLSRPQTLQNKLSSLDRPQADRGNKAKLDLAIQAKSVLSQDPSPSMRKHQSSRARWRFALLRQPRDPHGKAIDPAYFEQMIGAFTPILAIPICGISA